MDLLELLKQYVENQESFEAIQEEAHNLIEDLEPNDQLIMMRIPDGSDGVEIIKCNLELEDETRLFLGYLKSQIDSK